MSLDFLLEIGTEEIPHWMIPGALEQLSKLDLFGAKVSVDATPRRLVVWASGLPERTPDSEQVVKGPPLTSGDKAAEGFAKKQGVDVSAMQKVGEYYELRKSIPGRPVRELLAESLAGTILGIQWPKTMYWTGGKTGPRFIRPIRWIVEDAERWLVRERRRGKRYHGIVLDPPSYGHGTKGQAWEIHRDLVPLVEGCWALLSRDAIGKLLDPTAYTGLCVQMARESAKRARAATAAWRGNP